MNEMGLVTREVGLVERVEKIWLELKDGWDELDGKIGLNGDMGLDELLLGLDGRTEFDQFDVLGVMVVLNDPGLEKELDGFEEMDGLGGLDEKVGLGGLDEKYGLYGLDEKDGLAGLDEKDGLGGLNEKDGLSGLDEKDGLGGLNEKVRLGGLDGKVGMASLLDWLEDLGRSL